MKRTRHRKLGLHRETLRQLADQRLDAAAGGSVVLETVSPRCGDTLPACPAPATGNSNQWIRCDSQAAHCNFPAPYDPKLSGLRPFCV